MEGCSSSSSVVPPSCHCYKTMKTEQDRLTELPVSLLHLIFSFLDTQQIVQTSVLSRTWRHTWTSLSSLSLDHSTWKHITCVQSGSFRKLGFIQFVDRLMDPVHNPNIQNIHLNCNYCEEDHIVNWLRLAVEELGVKEIELEISGTIHHQLPRWIFKSAVTVFKLLNGNLSTQLPKSMRLAAKLRTLELVSAVLPNGNSEAELNLRCPILENLRMVDCDHHDLKVLNVSCPELKTLAISNSSPDWAYSPCSIKIRTPNLMSVSLKGHLYKGYDVDSFPSLVSADIEISGLMGSSESANAKHLVEILNGVYTVTTLRINNRSFELPMFEDMMVQFPNPFGNLRYLKLFWSENTGLHVITNALRSSQIETLVLQLHKAPPTNMDQGEDLWHEGMFYHLKFVKINNFSRYKNQSKVLELLLENATILQNLRIGLSPFSNNGTEKASILKWLNGLPKASSNVNISFLN